MNKIDDGCICRDFTGRNKDGYLHACGTILCEHAEGFVNGILLKGKDTINKVRNVKDNE